MNNVILLCASLFVLVVLASGLWVSAVGPYQVALTQLAGPLR